MDMKKYEEPVVEVLELDSDDVIATSGCGRCDGSECLGDCLAADTRG